MPRRKPLNKCVFKEMRKGVTRNEAKRVCKLKIENEKKPI